MVLIITCSKDYQEEVKKMAQAVEDVKKQKKPLKMPTFAEESAVQAASQAAEAAGYEKKANTKPGRKRTAPQYALDDRLSGTSSVVSPPAPAQTQEEEPGAKKRKGAPMSEATKQYLKDMRAKRKENGEPIRRPRPKKIKPVVCRASNCPKKDICCAYC
jgi:hypothetical protein